MRKALYLMMLLVATASFIACNSTETYAEKKETERKAINQWISDSAIKVISEVQFKEQGYTTDVEKNEYVLFDGTGVYMQIVNEGCGSVIAKGKTEKVLMRYREYDLKNKYVSVDFLSPQYESTSQFLDQMYVVNNSGTLSASYVAYSLCMTYYLEQSVSVPTGFLVPLKYVKIGRPSSEDEDVARVKLIIPHSAGRQTNTTNVVPCFYEATYELGL